MTSQFPQSSSGVNFDVNVRSCLQTDPFTSHRATSAGGGEPKDPLSIAEADDKFALSRAMRSLSIRIAKRINQLMGTRGNRIPQRYMLSVLRTKCEVQRALAYVLNNYRKHAAEWRRRMPDGWIDPCSSGVWFEHWSKPPNPTADPCPDLARGTVPPQSIILRHGWKAYGLIDPSQTP